MPNAAGEPARPSHHLLAASAPHFYPILNSPLVTADMPAASPDLPPLASLTLNPARLSTLPQPLVQWVASRQAAAVVANANANAHSASPTSSVLFGGDDAEPVTSADPHHQQQRMRPASPGASGPKLLIFMCGKPATGKSYLSKKLKRYLSWLGYPTRVFNVGDRRRVAAAASSVAPSPRAFVSNPINDEPQRTEQEPPLPAVAGAGATSAFFSPENVGASKLRDQIALDTLDEALAWLLAGHGKVAIHDATNTTRARRDLLVQRVTPHMRQIHFLFLESIVTDQALADRNIQMKLMSPDYLGMAPDEALADFRRRIANYEKAYQPLGDYEDEKRISYIKVINVGKKVVTSHIRGYLASQLVFYLMNMNIEERTIWITRHGESEFNVQGRVGGDAPLTERGRRYAAALARFFTRIYGTGSSPLPSAQTNLSHHTDSGLVQSDGDIKVHVASDNDPEALASDDEDDGGLDDQGSELASEFFPPNESCRTHSGADTPSRARVPIWTSTLQRTVQTADFFPRARFAIRPSKLLNEIHSGLFEGMTPHEIDAFWPVPGEVARRNANKLMYRFPGLGGESYLDVIARLKPVIIETERITHDVVIITHNVVARIMLGYYLGLSSEEMVATSVPLHALYALRPMPYGTELIKYSYDESADKIVRLPPTSSTGETSNV